MWKIKQCIRTNIEYTGDKRYHENQNPHNIKEVLNINKRQEQKIEKKLNTYMK